MLSLISFAKYWLPVIIYAIIILLLSAAPGSAIPSVFPMQDTFFHIVEYAAFAYLVHRAVRRTGSMGSFWNLVAVVCVGVVAYGVADEIFQHFTPGRQMSVYDVGMDSIGAFLGALIYR